MSPQRCSRRVQLRAVGLIGALAGSGTFMVAVASPAAAQTFRPTKAIEVRKCESRFGLFNRCTTVEAEVITRSFTTSKLGKQLFSALSSQASVCVRLTSDAAQCSRSVLVASDVGWQRLVWGVADAWTASFGGPGNGPGQFVRPLGVDLTRGNGGIHGAFVADAGNNRVAVIRLNGNTKTAQWLGAITGVESGKALAGPVDVAWDGGELFSDADDVVFIADRGNARVLIYGVRGVDAGSLAVTYLGQFGSYGDGSAQLKSPSAIAGYTYPGANGGWEATVVVADHGNERLALWEVPYGSPQLTGSATPRWVRNGSVSYPKAHITGLSFDHYYNVLAADVAGNRLLKFSWDLQQTKTYGGGSSWQDGRYDAPGDIQGVTYYEGTSSGLLQSQGLPYAIVAERWSDATGLQLVELGLEISSSTVTSTATDTTRQLSMTYALTSHGSGSVRVFDAGGALVKSQNLGLLVPGWHSWVWDGRRADGTLVPLGSYAVELAVTGPYSYDSPPLSHTVRIGFGFQLPPPPFELSIGGPTKVTAGTRVSFSVAANDSYTSPQWFLRGPTNDTEYEVGTGTSFSYSFGACGYHELRLRVTARDAVWDATKGIQVSQSTSGPACLMEEPGMNLLAVASVPAQDEVRQVAGAGTAGWQRLSDGGSRGMAVLRSQMVGEGGIAERGVRSALVALADRQRKAGGSGPAGTGHGTTAPLGSVGSTSRRIDVAISGTNGAVIRRVVVGDVQPGYYLFTWDGRDTRGRLAAPGVYLAVIDVDGRRTRVRLVLTPGCTSC
jgi:flagellar hook assembly protein FlgD